MAKHILSPEEFIEEVNRQLPDHFAYKAGMRVFLVPPDANGETSSGYDWEPKGDPAATRAVADVANLVRHTFDCCFAHARIPSDQTSEESQMAKPDAEDSNAGTTTRCKRQIALATVAAVVVIALVWRFARSRGWAPF
jgi:hypothetical protein